MIRDLSHKAESPPTECEVRVEIRDGDDWVRIPVVSSELWINKDGPSDLTRTAKIRFPGEWGGHSIVQYINGFSSADEDEIQYDEARIYYQDEDTGNYHIAHYGFVGGVGPAAENGVFKCWIYDPADLMKAIRVSKSFGEPTIQQVLNFVLRGTDDNGRDVGLENRSVFSDIKTYIAGIQEVALQKRVEEAREEEAFGAIGDAAQDGFNFVQEVSAPIVGPFQISIDDAVADVFDWAKDNLIDPLLTGQKRFQLNRHNMVDMMNWFASEVGGKWHFEPTPDGPVLFFDNTASEGVEETLIGARQREDGEISRRKFVDEELDEAQEQGDISSFRDRDAFDTIDVLDNQALYDIKPFNSLTLYGETHDPAGTYSAGPGSAYGPGPPAASVRSSRFPKVEVTYPPLVERAGGYEYSAPAVESDKITLSQARQEAIKQFRQHLTEETEGTIETKGNPFLLPYDYVTVVPVCNEIYPNVNATPITYEINSVKHTRAAGERYTCNLGVSLVLDETELEVEAEYMDA